MTNQNRIVTTLLALAIDLIFGDPPNRLHPLLLMGRWLKWGQRISPSQQRFWFGAGWIIAGTALFSLPWRLLRGARLIPPIIAAFLLKPIFAYRNLRQAVQDVGQALEQDDLNEARQLTSWHLVSRDTSQLAAPEVAGAAIESLAENLTDSVTAPLLAYALGGLPAAWAYRFINTADAMWGYRNPEFEQLGKFPAVLDDLLNWFPARLTGWLLVLASWLVGADAIRARRTMLAQHHTTPSPNAGWTMSAMAGALGVVLSKREVYNLVGGAYRPDAWAIHRAVRIADVCVGLVVLSALLIGRVLTLGYLRADTENDLRSKVA